MNTQLKLYLLFITLLFVFPLSNSAQENKENDTEELVKTQKIAFFTEKIGLTPREAEKFWPVYNDYWEKKHKIIGRWKKRFNYYLDHSEQLSDSKMEELADDYIRFEMQKAELLKEYNKKFKEILPISKVMKIYQADYEFKAYLLKKIKNSGDNNQQ